MTCHILPSDWLIHRANHTLTNNWANYKQWHHQLDQLLQTWTAFGVSSSSQSSWLFVSSSSSFCTFCLSSFVSHQLIHISLFVFPSLIHFLQAFSFYLLPPQAHASPPPLGFYSFSTKCALPLSLSLSHHPPLSPAHLPLCYHFSSQDCLCLLCVCPCMCAYE